MKTHTAFAVAFLLLVAQPSMAGQVASAWMDEAALHKTFSGTTIDGRYENGRAFTEVYAAGGETRLSDDQSVNRGHWSIRSGAFCTIYDDDPTGGCFRVMRTSENCYEFYFVARTEQQAANGPRPPDWTAQAWLTSAPSTCTAGSNV